MKIGVQMVLQLQKRCRLKMLATDIHVERTYDGRTTVGGPLCIRRLQHMEAEIVLSEDVYALTTVDPRYLELEGTN